MISRMKYQFSLLKQNIASLQNQFAPRRRERWAVAALLAVVYVLRVLVTRRYAAVTYFLYVYVLSAFLQFVAPRAAAGEAVLPGAPAADGEYKPYQRQLSEPAFWARVVRAHVAALACTLFPVFDIPVFAPLLVAYCAALTAVFVYQECGKWRAADVDARTALRYWVGLEKPGYA